MTKLSFKQFLLEKVLPANFAGELVKFVISKLPLEEINSYRGKYFNESGIYQIRFKPSPSKAVDIQEVLDLLRGPDAKRIGISDVNNIATSSNSGKYKGVTFTYKDLQYEAIIGSGQNAGEKFEKEVLKAMQDYVAGKPNELAETAFTALEDLDLDDFSVDDIEQVKARTGSTSRLDASPEEKGKIIADIILVMGSGDEIYLSVKNEKGDTVGQLGLVDTFKSDYTVDTGTKQYKQLIQPLELDAKKIKDGFRAYEGNQALSGQVVTDSDASSSDLADLLKRFFGVGYIYLRQKGKRFIATEINDEFLDDKLLSDVQVTEIRYPEAGRKQISVFLNSSSTKFKIEIRNAKGGIVPAQVQLKILSTTLDEMK
jgi:hypothetical protein